MQAHAPPVAQPHPRPTTGRRKPPSTLQPSSKQAPAIASHTVFTIKFPAPRVKRQPATNRSVVARSSAERRSNLRRRRGQRARTAPALSLREAPQSAEATWGGGAGQPSVEQPPNHLPKSTITHPTPDCHVGAPPPRNDTRPPPRTNPSPSLREETQERPLSLREAPQSAEAIWGGGGASERVPTTRCLCEQLRRAPKQPGEVGRPVASCTTPSVCGRSTITHPTPDCHVVGPPPRNDTRPRRCTAHAPS